jgi:hypothetical protein
MSSSRLAEVAAETHNMQAAHQVRGSACTCRGTRQEHTPAALKYLIFFCWSKTLFLHVVAAQV